MRHVLSDVLPACDTLPLHGLQASRSWERLALARQPLLMQQAGTAVAKLALALYPHARRIQVLCGPGNNGGDALVAARLLQAAGRRVGVTLCTGTRPPPPDAALALQQAQAAGLSIEPALPSTLHGDLLLDGLLGLGLARPPEGEIATAITALNAQHAPVLAIDLPSGLSGETGTSTLAVHARHTLSLLSLKPGLFTAQGRALCGDLWWSPLGQETCAPAADAWLLGQQTLTDWRTLCGPRGHASHKGSWGDVLIVGGAAGMRGAAWLSARAALAAGAGRVYACLLQADKDTSPADRPELMTWPERLLDQPERWQQRHTVIAGCGGGEAIIPRLPALLEHAQRLVLDADALNAVAADPQLRQRLRARQAQGLASVLTPHPLEAARLLNTDSTEVQADRLGAAQALSLDLRCTVLLKGSGTVIASPDQTPAINSSGNAALATAGTGDVLAGWLGGLWAQCASRPAPELTHRLACIAAYWHGAAAADQQAGPLRAADLIEQMHRLHAAA